MKRIVKAVLVASIALGLLSSCDQPPPKLTPVVVNQAFEHLLYIALYVAKDKGYFEQEGLDVTIKTGGGDAQAFAALTSGQAQFAQGDPAFVAIGHERGWDGRVVAMAVDRVAMWGITDNASIKPFSNPIGFKGYRVSTYPNPNTSYVVQLQLAQRAGLNTGTDTKIVQVQFGTELAALKAGQVDIAQTIEPNVSQAVANGSHVVFSYPEAWGPLAFTGVMTSKDMAQNHRDIVQKFVNAYEKALRFISTDFDGALEIAKKRLPSIPEAVLRTALRRLIDSHSIPAHAAVQSASWNSLIKIRLQVGDLHAPPPAELVDNSFATKAAQQ
jgi:NitT/TauT family transport system substrate-binding protein